MTITQQEKSLIQKLEATGGANDIPEEMRMKRFPGIMMKEKRGELRWKWGVDSDRGFILQLLMHS